MPHLGLEHPIIQAPLAGGGDTPELVAAVCEAGALGFIGASYLTPLQIVETGRAVRARTNRPFGINLFAPVNRSGTSFDPRPMLERVTPFFIELGLPAPEDVLVPADSFGEQLAAALEVGAAVFSFTFGMLPPSAVEAIKARGMFLMGTATTVTEAQALERAGVDAIIAQGSEAGGHRSTFLGSFEAGLIGTMALVPQVVDAVGVPVIASGGIMDGRAIAASLALGASAVQMGTAFLTCDEAGIPNVYKEAILIARDDETRLTRAFSGRPARGIVNRFMNEIDAVPGEVLPFPVQNSLTRPLRAAAGKQGRPEFLSLWAGQGARLARRHSAADLIRRLARETRDAVDRIRRREAAATDDVGGLYPNRAPLPERLRGMNRMVAEITAAMEGHPETVRTRRPAPSSWAANEVICHLRDIEELFLLRFRTMLAEDEPKFLVLGEFPHDRAEWGLDEGDAMPLDPDRWAEERQYLRNDTDAAIGALRRRREETLAFLNRLTPEQWRRGSRHVTLGRMTYDDWVALIAVHDEKHLDQIRRALDGRP
jgi:nitronate monooxygenase